MRSAIRLWGKHVAIMLMMIASTRWLYKRILVSNSIAAEDVNKTSPLSSYC